MFLFAARKGSRLYMDSRPGLLKAGLDGMDIYYSTSEDEYACEDGDYIVLVDTVVDKSRRNEVDADIASLINLHKRGGPCDGGIFRGAYFIAIIDKNAQAVTLVRDSSGVKSGYYFAGDGFVCTGNNVHQVAACSGVREFDEGSIYQLLYLDYLFDGCTYYDGVAEVRIGETVQFDSSGRLASSRLEPRKLADEESKMSFDEAVSSLRREIKKAHEKFACDDNVVLLSGGVDSAVILISLRDIVQKEKISSYSFRVKGVSEDETVYAKSIADHLGIKNRILEMDPENKANYRDFEDKVLMMNNPYYGMWIFGNLEGASLEKTFYAGQDTRLHTPDLNPIDKFAFLLFVLRSRLAFDLVLRLLSTAVGIFQPGKLANSRSRFVKAFARAVCSFDTEKYIMKYFFKLDRSDLEKQGLPLKHYDAVKDRFKMDLGGIRSQRSLYNNIVEIKWGEQYTDDIRYLQDMAKVNKTYIATPFYDNGLAYFSSSVPFDLATRFKIGRQKYSDKKSIINKYLLRMSFKDALNDDVFYRQKAVSSTLHLLMNGELGNIVTGALEDDQARPGGSFISRYKLAGFLDRYLKGGPWSPGDEKYILKVYYIAMLCVYNKRVLGAGYESVAQN